MVWYDDGGGGDGSGGDGGGGGGSRLSLGYVIQTFLAELIHLFTHETKTVSRTH